MQTAGTPVVMWEGWEHVSETSRDIKARFSLETTERKQQKTEQS